jgi:hypothetical protein
MSEPDNSPSSSGIAGTGDRHSDPADAFEEIPQEVMDRLPPDAQKLVKMSLSMHRVAPAPNPILNQVNAEHITQVLDLSERETRLEFWDAFQARLFTAFYVLLFVVALAGLAWFLVPPSTKSCFSRFSSYSRSSPAGSAAALV